MIQQCTFSSSHFISSLLWTRQRTRCTELHAFPQNLECFCTDSDFLTQDPSCSVRPQGQTAHLTKQSWLCSVTRSAESTQAEQVKLLDCYFFFSATVSQKCWVFFFQNTYFSLFFPLSARIDVVTAIRLNANTKFQSDQWRWVNNTSMNIQ